MKNRVNIEIIVPTVRSVHAHDAASGSVHAFELTGMGPWTLRPSEEAPVPTQTITQAPTRKT